MEMAPAISSRPTGFYPLKLVQFSSSPLNCISSISLPQKKSSGYGMASLSAKSRLGSLKGGAGLLERPNFDHSPFNHTPKIEEDGDIGQQKEKRGTGSGDSYRVLLIDDRRHTEKCVAQVLSHVLQSVTYEAGRKIFHESRQNGSAVVTIAVKEHAEYYSHIMTRWGVRSAIEPNSNIV